jgi:hypothetical protein
MEPKDNETQGPRASPDYGWASRLSATGEPLVRSGTTV